MLHGKRQCILMLSVQGGRLQSPISALGKGPFETVVATRREHVIYADGKKKKKCFGVQMERDLLCPPGPSRPCGDVGADDAPRLVLAAGHAQDDHRRPGRAVPGRRRLGGGEPDGGDEGRLRRVDDDDERRARPTSRHESVIFGDPRRSTDIDGDRWRVDATQMDRHFALRERSAGATRDQKFNKPMFAPACDFA